MSAPEPRDPREHGSCASHAAEASTPVFARSVFGELPATAYAAGAGKDLDEDSCQRDISSKVGAA